MAKRMMSAERASIGSFDHQDQKSEKVSTRKKLGAIVGAVSVSAAAFLNVAPASADEQVYVGGNCDTGAGYVSDTYRNMGMANPNARQVNIHYPASIGPICGPTKMRDSINIGANEVMREYLNNAPGEHFYVEGFSLGAAVADEFANRITDGGARPLPGNVHVIGSGDGYGAPGLLNHPIATLARIVTDPMGIPAGSELEPVPGQVVRFDINDFWGNGGSQGLNIGALIGMLARLGQDHRIPHPNEPHQTFVHKGVTYEVYGIERGDAISRAIVEAGGDPTDIGRFFFGILNGPQNPANSPAYRDTPAGQAQLATELQEFRTREVVAPVPPMIVEQEVFEQVVEDVVPQYSAPPAPIEMHVADEIVPNWDIASDLGF